LPTSLTRPPSDRFQSDEALGARIRESCLHSDRTYGARRVWHYVLRGPGLWPAPHRTPDAPPGPETRPPSSGCGERATIAPNVIDRGLAAQRPNRRCVADFTYVWTAEGWFSRRIVGWSMKAEMTALLVADALIMAIWRLGLPQTLLHPVCQRALPAADGLPRHPC
jgi:putative transposase